MPVDLKSVVGELLYEFDAVIIPGFGGFVANYKSSTIDHVQGLIHPPSKSLTFNENLVVNDGIILNHLKNKLGMSLEEAKTTLQRFVLELKSKMEAREIIVFPNVGRIYRDYEDKMQFLPDNSNYNLDVYGLPSVQFYPILRGKETLLGERKNTRRLPVVQARSNRRRRAALVQAAMPYLLGLALLAVAFSLYTVILNKQDGDDLDELAGVENRLNTKPSLREASYDVDDQFGTSITDPTSDVETDAAILPPIIEEMEEETDTESITLAPDQKECVVIVGGFRSEDNVRKLIERLYNKGYDAYQDQNGSLTRVGAQFFYRSEGEKREKIRLIREEFEPKAWVLKE